jgi:hypothetical protein
LSLSRSGESPSPSPPRGLSESEEEPVVDLVPAVPEDERSFLESLLKNPHRHRMRMTRRSSSKPPATETGMTQKGKGFVCTLMIEGWKVVVTNEWVTHSSGEFHDQGDNVKTKYY